MPEKNRERKYDKENYKKKQKRKQKIKQRRQSLTISRETRKYVRNQIEPYYSSFREFKDKHLLFVLKDTDNMERVLLQKHDLGKGITLLSLPVINGDMIHEYLSDTQGDSSSTQDLSCAENEAINGLTNYFYSITSDEIKDTPETNMMIFRNCKMTGSREDLIPLNVRPYDQNTWYGNETTTVHGVKVFKGNNLKTFFKTGENLSKTYVFLDTITELLLYKAMMGKINYHALLEDHMELAKHGNMFAPLYLALSTDFDELFERFKNEHKESQKLDER